MKAADPRFCCQYYRAIVEFTSHVDIYIGTFHRARAGKDYSQCRRNRVELSVAKKMDILKEISLDVLLAGFFISVGKASYMQRIQK